MPKITNPLFLTEQYKRAKVPATASMSTIARLTGLEYDVLRLAKKLGFPGVQNNGYITWKKFKPHLEAKYDDLKADLANDSIGLKTELLKRDLRIKELTIKKMEGLFLDVDDVKQFIAEICQRFSAVLKKEHDELPPRLAGRSEVDCRTEILKTEAKIFAMLQSYEAKVGKLAPKP